MPAASSPTRGTPPPRADKFNGLPGRGAVPSAAAGRAARGGATGLRRLRAVGRAARVGQTRRPAGVGDGSGRSDRSGWSSPATARSAPTSRRWRPSLGVGDRVRVPRRGRRRAAARCSTRGALAVLYPPYDEDFGYVTLEAFLVAASRSITATDSGGPNEFVIDGVNGFVSRAGAGGPRRRPSTRSRAIGARAAAHGRRRATSGRGRSPGTA